MFYDSWRGVVGVIKATGRPGSLEEFMRLLPEGIGVIPLFLFIKKGTEDEFVDVMEIMKAKIADHAERKVDLIHAEAAPVFMIKGYNGEQEIVKELEEKHKIPIVTSGMTQVDALRALGIKKMVVVTYSSDEMNKNYTNYFNEAGFEVLGIEGSSIPFAEISKISYQEFYAFTKKQYLKHKEAQGIHIIGSGWQVLKAIRYLEQDLQVPVVHPIAARVWSIQKRLFVRQPLNGYGRLLEEMP